MTEKGKERCWWQLKLEIIESEENKAYKFK